VTTIYTILLNNLHVSVPVELDPLITGLLLVRCETHEERTGIFVSASTARKMRVANGVQRLVLVYQGKLVVMTHDSVIKPRSHCPGF